MTTYLTGNDGNCKFGTSTTNHNAAFNVWNASFSRNVSDISAFGDSARRRRLGVADVSGSAGGFLIHDDPGPGVNTTDWSTDGVDMTLTAASGCTFAFGAIVSEIAISNAKTGDAAVSFNFQLSSGAAPTETWDETP